MSSTFSSFLSIKHKHLIYFNKFLFGDLKEEYHSSMLFIYRLAIWNVVKFYDQYHDFDHKTYNKRQDIKFHEFY